ncbi:MAG: hypothetical protein EP329_02330 [Deltaproteobacteria bacterium]|nr:MAG: hypothetical protein EP329_02330 [Deltaproteobacteria bacterium]
MTTSFERAPLALLSGVLALLTWTAAPSCIDSRCTQNRECPVGQICELATGACQVPECTRDAECGEGQVCNDYQCVAGCRSVTDCPADYACLEKRCVPVGTDCGCPLAPSFCVTDLNPRSATVGEVVCSADQPTTLFLFGNVGCSHCRALLDALLVLGEAVGDEAVPPVSFMQIGSIPVDEAAVGTHFAAYTVPVLPDGEALDIWHSYSADWYHVVLVDDHGCLAGHWGPLVPADIEGDVGVEMSAAWTNALTGACPADSAE